MLVHHFSSGVTTFSHSLYNVLIRELQLLRKKVDLASPEVVEAIDTDIVTSHVRILLNRHESLKIRVVNFISRGTNFRQLNI